MNASEINADIYHSLSIIAKDEDMLRRVAKYLRRLATPIEDETLMTKEEFFARIDEAKKGPSAAMLPNENLTDFLRRQGYAI